jgi:opacity protein-like surface antigen
MQKMHKTDNNPFLMRTFDSIPYYEKKLSSGVFWGGEVAYYMNKYIGLGLLFDYYFTSYQIGNFTYSYQDSAGTVFTIYDAYFSDNIKILSGKFFVTGRYYFPKRSYIYGNIGITMIRFKNQNHYLFTDNDRLGSTIGFAADIGYDVKLTQNIALGAKFSYNYGKLTKLSLNGNTTSLPENRQINLNRYGISLSFKVWLQQYNTKKKQRKIK